jgi:hypothetical protein
MPQVCHTYGVLLTILGTLALVGAAVGIGLWIDRRVSVLPRVEELQEASRPKLPGGEHEAGTAPQTALHSDPAQMARVIARQKCTCKAALVEDGRDDIRYADKLLVAVRLHCPSCGATRHLYFEPKA